MEALATVILRKSEVGFYFQLVSTVFVSGANNKTKQTNKPQEATMCADPIKIG